jgi:hypothetical protein
VSGCPIRNVNSGILHDSPATRLAVPNRHPRSSHGGSRAGGIGECLAKLDRHNSCPGTEHTKMSFLNYQGVNPSHRTKTCTKVLFNAGAAS